MKNILYALVILSIFSCKNKPKENVVTATPGGLQSNGGLTKAPPVLIFNPPHGKPGHDCAIAEGAPFNTAKKPVARALPIKQQITKKVTASAFVKPVVSDNKKVVKLNPAHGQKGHNCGLAVGAPLNSIPTAQATQIIKPTVETKTLDVKSQEPKSNLKINPAHGEPGHRCGIAVGAPLT